MPEVDLSAAVDRAFAWGVAQPFREAGYAVGRRHARRRESDLYLWLQLFGVSRGLTDSRDVELRGGVAVEACLPFTRSPDKPWQWSQATTWWQSILVRYEPGAGAEQRGYIRSAEALVVWMRDEAQRFLREVDDRFRSSADVREALWHQTVRADPRQGPQHLAVLLAATGDEGRLRQALDRLGPDDVVARRLTEPRAR